MDFLRIVETTGDEIVHVDQNIAKSKELEEYILKTLKIIVVLQVSVKKSIYRNLVKNRKYFSIVPQ